mmetsp:Transcript_15095/g.25691  ORF Transcript_15095/g.25691 Transcript_15095/m.25691 type:complete len:205 (+) Transcript_15095:213-827(+)
MGGTGNGEYLAKSTMARRRASCTNGSANTPPNGPLPTFASSASWPATPRCYSSRPCRPRACSPLTCTTTAGACRRACSWSMRTARASNWCPASQMRPCRNGRSPIRTFGAMRYSSTARSTSRRGWRICATSRRSPRRERRCFTTRRRRASACAARRPSINVAATMALRWRTIVRRARAGSRSSIVAGLRWTWSDCPMDRSAGGR